MRVRAWKCQDLNGVWTRDLAIPVGRSNQLSYEATDVGSWSFVSSNEPVTNGCEVIYEMFHILNCGFWNQNTSYITSQSNSVDLIIFYHSFLNSWRTTQGPSLEYWITFKGNRDCGWCGSISSCLVLHITLYGYIRSFCSTVISFQVQGVISLRNRNLFSRHVVLSN